MAETFAWPEGTVYLWTGTATASAIVAYAERVYGTLVYGVDNFRTLDGTYHNLWTGQRADIYVARSTPPMRANFKPLRMHRRAFMLI